MLTIPDWYTVAVSIKWKSIRIRRISVGYVLIVYVTDGCTSYPSCTLIVGYFLLNQKRSESNCVNEAKVGLPESNYPFARFWTISGNLLRQC